MPVANPFHFRNQLLSAMESKELFEFSGKLERVSLPRRMRLEIPHKAIEHIYFIESGIASIVAPRSDSQVEVGIIGREGITGLAVLHGNHQSPLSVYMQVAGDGLRIEADALVSFIKMHETARTLFLAFAQSFLLQVSETAVSNARSTIEQRLSRWLLMAHDRVDSDEIPLTHEFLSMMMGARRPGVTEAVRELTRKGLIDAKRGLIRIVDRHSIEAHAADSYGLPEKEYARLVADCSYRTETKAPQVDFTN